MFPKRHAGLYVLPFRVLFKGPFSSITTAGLCRGHQREILLTYYDGLVMSDIMIKKIDSSEDVLVKKDTLAYYTRVLVLMQLVELAF